MSVLALFSRSHIVLPLDLMNIFSFARKMKSRDEWYSESAVEIQNKSGGNIQPLIPNDDILKEDFELYETINLISKHFPEFRNMPIVDDFFPVEIISRIKDFVFFRPKFFNFPEAEVEGSIKHRKVLRDFQNEFNALKEKIEAEDLTENDTQPFKPIFSHPVLARFQNELFRAMVYEFDEDNEYVTVLLVDEGEIKKCKLADVKGLPLRHMKVPRFSLHVQISGLTGEDFEQLQNKFQVAAYKDLDNTFEIFSTSNEKDIWRLFEVGMNKDIE